MCLNKPYVLGNPVTIQIRFYLLQRNCPKSTYSRSIMRDPINS